MSILTYFKNLFKKKDDLIVTAEFLERYLNINFPDCKITTRDDNYILPTKQQIDTVLYWVENDKRAYEKDFLDCDDFADMVIGDIKHKTRGWALCYVSTNIHAVIGIVDYDMNVWFIEPSNGQEIKDCNPTLMRF